MKKLLALVFAFCCFTASSQGQIIEKTQTDINLKLRYPLIYVENQTAQEAMNQLIASYVGRMQTMYYKEKMYQVVMNYDITYEDENVLSLSIEQGWYNGQAAHGYYTHQGLVFNKHTGERIPAYNYVKLANNQQLKELVSSGMLSVYSQDMKNRLYPQQLFGLPDVEVHNDNYVLLGNGAIGMLYQPYELSAYAYGVTTILFPLEKIEYINRLNS
ncbi:DUF3298 and DUF4163 domain-containing protein [Veillonella criceti]|uniref:Protein of uncharacterized function (DUF3298) n=1 Tax=Veillonella criceti TaxID=103891 RepID=A0A380NNP2_9FIRM|nr:DUF3298 and DUF4163 domain-containing protein [Veillonella criceti]SUP44378.1 Protein of uncharacterised function (DUF3298) [Veillonella criceti]